MGGRKRRGDANDIAPHEEEGSVAEAGGDAAAMDAAVPLRASAAEALQERSGVEPVEQLGLPVDVQPSGGERRAPNVVLKWWGRRVDVGDGTRAESSRPPAPGTPESQRGAPSRSPARRPPPWRRGTRSARRAPRPGRSGGGAASGTPSRNGSSLGGGRAGIPRREGAVRRLLACGLTRRPGGHRAAARGRGRARPGAASPRIVSQPCSVVPFGTNPTPALLMSMSSFGWAFRNPSANALTELWRGCWGSPTRRPRAVRRCRGGTRGSGPRLSFARSTTWPSTFAEGFCDLMSATALAEGPRVSDGTCVHCRTQ